MVAAIRERVSWVLMAILAIVIIVIGFEGSLGKVLGCIFTPGLMVVGNEASGYTYGGKTYPYLPPGKNPTAPKNPDGTCPPGYSPNPQARNPNAACIYTG